MPNTKTSSLLYIVKRVAIRAARVCFGIVLIIYGLDFVEDAVRMADIQFSNSSVTILIKMIASGCFGLYLIYASFVTAFWAGPSSPD